MSKKIICPHCKVKGKVKTEYAKKKDGLSGGKILGGLITGGWSLLGTGLSRKHKVTKAHCKNCGAKWIL